MRYSKAGDDQNARNNVMREMRPFQDKMADCLAGDRSLLGKTLRGTLNVEQRAKYDAARDERRRYRYLASIETSLVALENSVPLTGDQHDALVHLLIMETAPRSFTARKMSTM